MAAKQHGTGTKADRENRGTEDPEIKITQPQPSDLQQRS
jgi:hypothetical protein